MHFVSTKQTHDCDQKVVHTERSFLNSLKVIEKIDITAQQILINIPAL